MRCVNMRRYFIIGNSYIGGSFFGQCFGEKWAVCFEIMQVLWLNGFASAPIKCVVMNCVVIFV